MGEKETTLKELGEMLAHVVEHMATKDDIKDMATKEDLKGLATKDELKAFREEAAENFRAIRAELADIRRGLDDLRSRVANIIGYEKEIDHALERIAAIEKHLGIEKRIAA
jgi:hypothetical protein